MRAALYDAALAPLEAAGLRAQRATLLAQARGRVLDVGAGTGLNLPHYRDVVSVTACEPDPDMRRGLDRHRQSASVPVEVLPYGLPDLPLPDASFDTVVCTLVLCTVPDPPASLATLRRVLAPDGQMLFFEHVLARTSVGRVQRLLAPAWARVAGGCRLDRDTIGTMRAAGFVITDCERLGGQVAVRGRAVVHRP